MFFFAWPVLPALFYGRGRVTKLRNITINDLRVINFNRAEIYGQFVETFTADEPKVYFSCPCLLRHKSCIDIGLQLSYVFKS